MLRDLAVDVKTRPELDPGFLPAVLWHHTYRDLVEAEQCSLDLGLSLERPDGSSFSHTTRILPHEGANVPLNRRHVERLVKFLLWQKGGSRIHVGGCLPLAESLSLAYAAGGDRAFDREIVGERMFGEPVTVSSCAIEDLPPARERTVALGRNLDGCRIGFDLGGSDRKGAALIDGEVVYSEEIKWDPYFQQDPRYHYDGIQDTLARAAAKLPRVDAIGGSAAGVYVNNQVRVASLFRGVPTEQFERDVRPIFLRLREDWNDVPFEVVNDGEVTALAGSMALGDNALLGVSMGTSEAAGYCDPAGHITSGLNELAFAPIDYRPDAPVDEWSGDVGCGVQYFSQQGVARLAELAGFELPDDMPLAERLIAVQEQMVSGDDRARRVFSSIGTCFGYAIGWYAEFYDFRNLLVLGRVTSGDGGALIIEKAEELLRREFPQLAETITLRMPGEKEKRHGQAMAAASLPRLG